MQTASKYLGNLSVSTGDLEEAEFFLRKSLAITREIGFVRDIINLLYEIARLRVAQERSEEAIELLVLVIQHPSSDQTRWLEGSIRDSAKGSFARLEDEISTDKFSSATTRGQAFELDHVVAALLSYDNQAQEDTH